MSLVISLRNERKTPAVSFDNDGYYWFLHPFFEQLGEQTGQFVDLYGHAIFVGPALDRFTEMLAMIRQHISKQPGIWDVHIGTQTHPERKKLYSAVDRTQFLLLIGQLIEMTAMARRSDCGIECFGD